MTNGHRPVVWILCLVRSNRNDTSTNDALVDHSVERWIVVGLSIDLVSILLDEGEHGNSERVDIYRSGSNNVDVEESLTGFISDHDSKFGRRHEGDASGNIAEFMSDNMRRARIDKNGRGFFAGGTQTGGADLAEAFEVEEGVEKYEPGDVLVISTRSDRRVERSSEPYSTRVIGVYTTKPGVLLTDRDIDDSLDDTLPVGVVGVISTKVSAENGAIRRGDLLVSASTPGHAMRGTDRDRLMGAVVGKALAEFEGPGTGVILVMVNVR